MHFTSRHTKRVSTVIHLRIRATGSFGNSFSFLDVVLGEDSRESLVYIAKLSADPVLIRLVSEHGSTEFMKHNKSLLFTERGLDLLEGLKGAYENRPARSISELTCINVGRGGRIRTYDLRVMSTRCLGTSCFSRLKATSITTRAEPRCPGESPPP